VLAGGLKLTPAIRSVSERHFRFDSKGNLVDRLCCSLGVDLLTRPCHIL